MVLVSILRPTNGLVKWLLMLLSTMMKMPTLLVQLKRFLKLPSVSKYAKQLPQYLRYDSIINCVAQDLDLDAFADELERQGFGNKRITLYDIRSELNHRYKDGRPSFQAPSPEDIFNMVTKENPQTFFIGKLLMATVTGFQHRKPKREELDRANPNRNETTGLWQCPFCLQV